MRKTITLVCLCLLALQLFLLPSQSSAELIRVPDRPLVFDPATELYWYTDLARFLDYTISGFPWTAASTIDIPGYTFRDASIREVETLALAISADGPYYDIYNMFMFTPTSIPSGPWGSNGSYFFWAALTSDSMVSDWGETFHKMYGFYVDPTEENWEKRYVSTFSTYPEFGSVMQAPDLALSMWVVGEKEGASAAPVPEPATLLLVGGGIAGLMAWAARRRTLRT